MNHLSRPPLSEVLVKYVSTSNTTFKLLRLCPSDHVICNIVHPGHSRIFWHWFGLDRSTCVCVCVTHRYRIVRVKKEGRHKHFLWIFEKKKRHGGKECVPISISFSLFTSFIFFIIFRHVCVFLRVLKYYEISTQVPVFVLGICHTWLITLINLCRIIFSFLHILSHVQNGILIVYLIISLYC